MTSSWPTSTPGNGRPPGSPSPGTPPLDGAHVPPREVLDYLLPANAGPERPEAPSWAVDAATPVLDSQRTPTAPDLAEQHAHRLLFARWLRERKRIGEWRSPDE